MPKDASKISLRAKRMDEETPEGPFRHVDNMDELMATSFDGLQTINEVFAASVAKNGSKQCLGTREVISEETTTTEDGKDHKLVHLGKYKYKTYDEVFKDVDTIGHGLGALGMQAEMKIAIFLETSAEWFVTCHACFRNNFPVVTVYATLDEVGITHALSETEVTHVVTSTVLLNSRLLKCLDDLPCLQHIFLVENEKYNGDEMLVNRVKVTKYCDLETIGRARSILAASRSITDPIIDPPTKDSLAIIMYTSGQSGEPKGVMINHSNFVAALSGISSRIPDIGSSDVYIGYLPLAHVLELVAENCMAAAGARIGYSSPFTLTDKSMNIKPGTKGDASELKPTLMACVPEIMERMRKSVNRGIEEKSEFQQSIFRNAFAYKLKEIEKGKHAPLLDTLVFKKTRKIIGGKVRALLSGGAPLNSKTQAFMNVCMCCPVVQGYGLTETCGAATITEIERDFTYGRTGPPLPCCALKLVAWEEGGYAPTSDPPRGEIVIGGPNVAQGYYKKPEKTAEDFFVDESGMRWFKTGDIGQFDNDGCLRVVDRKKDLVKLSRGEYIALGNIEAKLKASPFIDNIWLYADPEKTYPLAFVVPNELAIRDAIHHNGRRESIDEFCQQEDVEEFLKKAIELTAEQTGMQKFEIPQKIFVESHPWLPEDGLTTAAFKLKRKSLETHYHINIEGMYSQAETT